MNFLDYTFKINRRAKRISITVKRDGSCVVNVPFRRASILQNMLLSKAEHFVVTKKEWIEKQREKYIKLQKKINKLRKLRDLNGAGNGDVHGNGNIGGDGNGLGDSSSNPASQAPISASKLSEKELKVKTLHIVTERLKYFNTFYNFTYKDVRVKKVSTRWGSCSRKGNLNFSHKLALLLPEEIDYVVVHELCHLAEFNHGPNFWKLVERTIPNYLQIRKGMKVAMF
ncbi:MAG: M48 family metallopeptidase [Candidatus Pacebacteria bacterium]|nr:M48 family metallopeptidase [Candidatus Paceibacterota bacterium]